MFWEILVANRWVDADTAAKLGILLMKIRMLLIHALAMVEMIIINKKVHFLAKKWFIFTFEDFRSRVYIA